MTFREFRVQLTQAAPVTMKNAFLLVGLEAGSLKKIEVRFPETGSVRIQVRFWIEFSDSTTRYKNHLIPWKSIQYLDMMKSRHNIEWAYTAEGSKYASTVTAINDAAIYNCMDLWITAYRIKVRIAMLNECNGLHPDCMHWAWISWIVAFQSTSIDMTRGLKRKGIVHTKEWTPSRVRILFGKPTCPF